MTGFVNAQPVQLQLNAASSRAASKSVSPIQTQFKAYKVHFGKDGKEELEAASDASAGDLIEYWALHRNTSSRRLLNVDFAIPIPWGTSLWQGSVQPAHGKLVEAAIGAASKGRDQDRSRVVWRVEIMEPGQRVELKLRVRIDPDPSMPATPHNPFAPRKPQLRSSESSTKP
ncbi:MAG: hypothetical protein HC858_05765 [Brachymonas sp.]|nr:hypothetical protein [Brachymonas sp.]